jgi:hypothetical protein
MTGYYWAMGTCVACGSTISFNPDYVPSIRVDGKKEPLCRGCFGQWNQIYREQRYRSPLLLSGSPFFFLTRNS